MSDIFRKELTSSASLLYKGLSVLVVLFLWWLVCFMELVPLDYFPSPLSVQSKAVLMFGQEEFIWHILASSARIYVAFLIAAIIGVPLGLLMSSIKVVNAIFEPLIDFIRYIPVPALLPLFVLISGIGEEPKFLVLFFGTFFQLVLIIKDDADHVPIAYFEVAKTMGANTFQLIRDILFPYMLPKIYDSLRVTLGWCWTYLVIAELIAVKNYGMGRLIKEAQRFQDTERLYVCLITLGFIGLFTDLFAKKMYNKLFPYAVK